MLKLYVEQDQSTLLQKDTKAVWEQGSLGCKNNPRKGDKSETTFKNIQIRGNRKYFQKVSEIKSVWGQALK